MALNSYLAYHQIAFNNDRVFLFSVYMKSIYLSVIFADLSDLGASVGGEILVRGAFEN
jgi:hypothetical protein